MNQLQLQEVSIEVFIEKYAKNGEVTLDQNRRRVAKALASVENENVREDYEERFYYALDSGFIPAGRISSAAGTNIQATLINCFVQPIGDAMRGMAKDGRPSIMKALEEAAETLRRGGGVGYNFSHLRPCGGFVSATNSRSSGPVSFMRVFDKTCETVESAGARRGAQMGVLNCDHPDIEEFIHAKDTGDLKNFNISIAVTDAFMEAVEKDADFQLVHVAEPHPEVIAELGAFQREDGMWVYRTVKARALWDQVMQSTYDHAEPGILYVDRMNQENNLYYCEDIEATNPCVTGDTRLATQYGLVRMDELYRSQETLQVTVDKRALGTAPRGVDIRPAVPVFMTAELADVYQITTQAGYTIKATEWHDFYTTRGKVKLRDLTLDDVLLVQSGLGQFGTEGSYELGMLMGLIAGDGHFTARGNGVAACVGLWGENRAVASECVAAVNRLIRDEPRYRRVESVSIEGRDMESIRSVVLASVLDRDFGFNARTKLVVPEVVWKGSESCVRGYLHGLFQTDGTILVNQGSNTCSIRLSSISEDYLGEIQMLLANFGVFSTIRLARVAGFRELPDGRGGYASYPCKDSYELIVDGESRNAFAQHIGFLLPEMNDKLLAWMDGKKLYKTQSFTAAITSIEYIGVEAVYDTTQADNNTVIFNGLVTGQCAEQPLPNYGCCDLGSINLTKLIIDPFTERATFDTEKFIEVVGLGVRMLDNVLDLTYWPLEQQKEQSDSKRRIGLGFTGLGDALVMMRIKYNSPEGLHFAEQVSRIMRDEAYRASVKLAIEKGVFPMFDADKYLDSGFARRLPEHIRDYIRANGIRNSHLLSIAPTGTISLSFADNASNGIEPAFSWTYNRKKRMDDGSSKILPVEDHAWRLYRHLGGDVNNLPSYFVTALEMSADDHMRMLEVVQPYIDTSISKTVNVPADYPYEEFKDLYYNGWKAGLKGLATYRPNNILGAVLSVAEEPKVGDEFPVGALKDLDPLTVKFKSRPAGDLNAITRKMVYYTLEGEKKIYLSVSFMVVDGVHNGEAIAIERPIEFFVPAGQQDDSQQWVAATMRLLSQISRSGASVADALADLREVVWDKGLVRYGQIDRPDGSKGTRHHESEVAALAYALQEMLQERGFLDTNFRTVDLKIMSSMKALTMFSNTMAAIKNAVQSDAEIKGGLQVMGGAKCGECGEFAVIKVDGCKKCTSCGAIGACG